MLVDKFRARMATTATRRKNITGMKYADESASNIRTNSDSGRSRIAANEYLPSKSDGDTARNRVPSTQAPTGMNRIVDRYKQTNKQTKQTNS